MMWQDAKWRAVNTRCRQFSQVGQDPIRARVCVKHTKNQRCGPRCHDCFLSASFSLPLTTLLIRAHPSSPPDKKKKAPARDNVYPSSLLTPTPSRLRVSYKWQTRAKPASQNAKAILTATKLRAAEPTPPLQTYSSKAGVQLKRVQKKGG
ncbi:hypothetical protein EJ06DRAFT_401129 [Trichodelitschia bisporula]|uniref:Uncharacterized protein n=1 Tax=Trichodelitschia bisporula TaxID=703511 RepID=A0A6G1HXT5_9PEZI|nr:hypothetical protein EJ06DRAFT_401129 [Trichodelitschia bisporula]